jgi:hypothetical protein
MSFEVFCARSAALRPSKPTPGLLGAAAREPRRKEKIFSDARRQLQSYLGAIQWRTEKPGCKTQTWRNQ